MSVNQEKLRRWYLAAMGIDVWETREPPVPYAGDGSHGAVETETPAPVASPQSPAGSDVATLDWEALRERVAGCTACALHESRTRTVFGVGDPCAQLMVVGEAPGADEDRQGEPFVGRAGQLLNEMLRAIGLERERVYIANILKCRPPRNRDPLPEEMSCCEGYLRRQVSLIRPRLIVAVGRVAAHNLLHTDVSLARLRQRLHPYGDEGIPLVATYHPAYLLRSPRDKRKAWQDLQFIRDALNRGSADS